MKIETIELTLYYGFFESNLSDIRTSLGFCESGVRSAFDIPKNFETVWLEVHDKPSEDRYAVTNHSWVVINGDRYEFLDSVSRWLDRLMKNGTIYIGAEY